MDQQSAEASFSLHPNGSKQRLPGKFTWADDGAGFAFKPGREFNAGY